MSPVLEMVKVSYAYPGQAADSPESAAVKQVDLIVNEGEWVAVLGANGSGKSTLAKLASGLLLPQKGAVFICGCDTRTEPFKRVFRQRVGMVLQNPENHFVAETVEDDMAFTLELHRVDPSEMRERMVVSLRSVGLSEQLLSRSVHQLSGGQKQRLALAEALLVRPSLLLLDEATSMLDPAGRREVMEQLVQLSRSKVGVIMITHQAEEALLADRLLVMDAGEIRFLGSVGQFLQYTAMSGEAPGVAPPWLVLFSQQLIRAGVPLCQVHYEEQPLLEELWRLFSGK